VLLYLALFICFRVLLPRSVLVGGALVLVLLGGALLLPFVLPSAAPAAQKLRPAPATSATGVPAAPPAATRAPTATPMPTPLALAAELTAQYAPGPGADSFGPIAAGVPYTPTARYGWDWLQADFAGAGRLWVAASVLDPAAARLPALPNLAPDMPAAAVPTHLLHPGEQAPRLPQSLDIFHAPGAPEAAAGSLPPGTPYDLRARYGATWVQADFAGHGTFWGQASTMDMPAPAVAALPDLRPIVGYGLYVAAAGDDVAQVAALGGSSPGLLRDYNRLTPHASLVPGHPLIVPRLEGHGSALAPAPFLVKHGSRAQPYVALTIDVEMGDTSYLLDVLREHNARATFFVTGAWAQAHPDALRRMVAEGHELGNHSVTHPDFRLISSERIAWELAETERLVQAATDATTRPYFRPPYGGYDDRVLRDVVGQGYLPIFWTLDTQDAIGWPKSADFVAQRITGTYAAEHMPGMITLSHCCAARHVLADALPAVLQQFAAQGIEARPLSEVLGN
jgi:peptidoglycan/xylan/chitin deacetylase (PgdA/CDA1 family)